MSQTQSDLVELLEKALHAEIESSYQYLALANSLEGVQGEIIADDLRDDFEEEMGHALRISERLETLDEVPSPFGDIEASHGMLNPRRTPSADLSNLMSCVEGVVEAEESAIELYTEIIEVANELDDSTTRRLAEELLEDEEQHIDEFQSYLEGLKSRKWSGN